MLPFACRPLALAILATFAVAGCLGSGPDDVGGRATPSGPAECSAAQAPALDAQPPGLASHAAANQYDEAAGERTWRWDLVVDGACQLEATAHASVEVGTPPEYCAPPRLRASVTTGLTEADVPLEGAPAAGSLSFSPRRTDLAAGPASFVVSLAATLPSGGFEQQDDRCLDGTLQHIVLAADFRQARTPTSASPG